MSIALPRCLVSGVVALLLAVLATFPNMALAQSALEMNAAGNSQSGTSSQTRNDLTVSMVNNTDNPSGLTFTAVSPPPTPNVTFTLTNQQYSVPTSVHSTGYAATIGVVSGSTATYYAQLGSFGGPVDSYFTSAGQVAPGTGISVVSNYGVRFLYNVSPLASASVEETARIHMADLVISFDTPVTDPVLHFGGLGGEVSLGRTAKGFATEFDLVPGGNVTGWTALSGNTPFLVSGNSLYDNAAVMGASCGAGTAACGSVRINGQNITQITLRTFIRSSSPVPWSFGGVRATAGDAFHISVSLEAADVQPTLSNFPATIQPGTTYTGLTATCTNNGPNTARNVSCGVLADIGTVSNLSCVPAMPGDLAPSASAVCTFDYVLNAPGSATQVVFTGQSSASNDRNGGSDPAAGNNQIQASIAIQSAIDAVDDALAGLDGLSGATSAQSVLDNDTLNG
ncbi:hypothetical protein LV82_02977, partial [Albidovulum inexpectatum]